MPKIINIAALENVSRSSQTFEKRGDVPHAYDWTTSPRLGALAGLKNLMVDVRQLQPGKFSFPYHFHRASEEFFLILSGSATLRTPLGFQVVSKDDLVAFETGPQSAHQLYNHTDAACVYLDVRAHHGIDVAEYPDTGKINVLPTMEVFERGTRVEYYSGEDNPAAHWPADIVKPR